MASIRSRNNKLIIDFHYKGKRCREMTKFKDTEANRKKLAAILKKIEAEIILDRFDYAAYFPNSKNIVKQQIEEKRKEDKIRAYPTFSAFAKMWFDERAVEWRASSRDSYQRILDKYLLPQFGEHNVSQIQKGDLLAFRSSLAKVRYSRTNKPLSMGRINHIMHPLKMILQDAAERYGFPSPYRHIKRLKAPSAYVQPFSLDEVSLLLDTVQEDYRDYFIVRFFTGMRSSEIHGLKRKHIDLDNHRIHVCEALVGGKMGPTKNESSKRSITMSRIVHEAMTRQMRRSAGQSDFVFYRPNGKPLDSRYIGKNIWRPLLDKAGLAYRRCYQTRHTTATLWLAVGENPEWIAKQMGHKSVNMLFKVYSQYVPHAIRKDGSALEAMLAARVPLMSATPQAASKSTVGKIQP